MKTLRKNAIRHPTDTQPLTCTTCPRVLSVQERETGIQCRKCRKLKPGEKPTGEAPWGWGSLGPPKPTATPGGAARPSWWIGASRDELHRGSERLQRSPTGKRPFIHNDGGRFPHDD